MLFPLILLLFSVRSNQPRIKEHSLIMVVINGLRNVNAPRFPWATSVGLVFDLQHKL